MHPYEMAEIKYSNFISNIGKETDKLDHSYIAMDRGAWRATGHGAKESNTPQQLNNNCALL